MTYLNKLKNILSNKKFDYIILLTTIGLLNGNNIYASSNEETEPDTLKNLLQIYMDFFNENNGKHILVPEEDAATLLNKNQDSIKKAFHQHPNINFRATSCISRCCYCKSFADSYVLDQNNEGKYLKSIVKQTFFMYNIPTGKMLYIPAVDDFIRISQYILFECFDKNLSELTSSLKEYYQKNKIKYNNSMPDITDETFNDENIGQMLLQ